MEQLARWANVLFARQTPASAASLTVATPTIAARACSSFTTVGDARAARSPAFKALPTAANTRTHETIDTNQPVTPARSETGVRQMADRIDAKAYAQPCGCGAPAGEPCPHTPIRCAHEFWYGDVHGVAGPWRSPPSPIAEGTLRTCELCGLQQRATQAWEHVRSSYPA